MDEKYMTEDNDRAEEDRTGEDMTEKDMVEEDMTEEDMSEEDLAEEDLADDEMSEDENLTAEEEESKYLEMYVKEMEEIAPCGEEEIKELTGRLLDGDMSVSNRLTEGNLHRVIKIAETFSDSSVSLPDLVQEGNMALVLAIGDFADGGISDFTAFIEEEIKAAMKRAIEKQDISDKTAKKVLDRVELLDIMSRRMAEELGREPTVPELAERMQMTEDEVKDIMKVTVDAVNAKQSLQDFAEE